MPIDFKALRIYAPLDFGDYNEQLRGQTLGVWVNLSRAYIRELSSEEKKEPDDIKAIYCELWNIDAEGYAELFEAVDPPLWTWIVERTWKLINEDYPEQRKNAGAA